MMRTVSHRAIPSKEIDILARMRLIGLISIISTNSAAYIGQARKGKMSVTFGRVKFESTESVEVVEVENGPIGGFQLLYVKVNHVVAVGP